MYFKGKYFAVHLYLLSRTFIFYKKDFFLILSRDLVNFNRKQRIKIGLIKSIINYGGKEMDFSMVIFFVKLNLFLAKFLQ